MFLIKGSKYAQNNFLYKLSARPIRRTVFASNLCRHFDDKSLVGSSLRMLGNVSSSKTSMTFLPARFVERILNTAVPGIYPVP